MYATELLSISVVVVHSSGSWQLLDVTTEAAVSLAVVVVVAARGGRQQQSPKGYDDAMRPSERP